MRRALLLAALPILLTGKEARAQRPSEAAAESSVESIPDPNYIFYRPDVDFGSASVMGPLNVFFNRGFSVLHFRDQPRGFRQLQWGTGFASVRDALTHPGAAIERIGGLGPWLKREFFPSAKMWEWAWAPNFGGHIIAGGITTRYLEEWFEANGVPMPALSAAVYMMGTMVVNETLEHQRATVGSAGTVADLLIFDPLGILLFRIDGLARFFQRELHAADWSPQAAVTFPSVGMQNVSQVMAYKVPLPFLERTRLLILLGQLGLTGVSYRLDNGLSFGVTGGIDGDVRIVDLDTGLERIRPQPAGGLYVDRDDSLLASVVLAPRAFNRIKVNVYPGVLPGRLGSLGLWATVAQGGEFSFGLSSRSTLGLGTGVDFNHR